MLNNTLLIFITVSALLLSKAVYSQDLRSSESIVIIQEVKNTNDILDMRLCPVNGSNKFVTNCKKPRYHFHFNNASNPSVDRVIANGYTYIIEWLKPLRPATYAFAGSVFPGENQIKVKDLSYISPINKGSALVAMVKPAKSKAKQRDSFERGKAVFIKKYGNLAKAMNISFFQPTTVFCGVEKGWLNPGKTCEIGSKLAQ